MAYSTIEDHFLGKQCLWTSRSDDDTVDKITRAIDQKRLDIVDSMMHMYGVDICSLRFVDFVDIPVDTTVQSSNILLNPPVAQFKGRPKFSKDCRVRSKRGNSFFEKAAVCCHNQKKG